jgi:hypothetical protein
MQTKQVNPYMKSDRNVFVHKIDFAVQRTNSGEITVDYLPDSTQVSMIQAGVSTNSIMGNNVLETSPYSAVFYPMEQFQDRLWHPIYFQASGNCIQLYFYMTLDQMVTPTISLSDFQLEGMVIYAQPTASRMQ